MTQLNIGDYESKGDSKSLKNIDGQAFTIVAIEESSYDDKGKAVEGVKISTKESFKDDDGKECNKFHTTRHAIVKKFVDDKVQSDLMKKINSGDTMKVKCEKIKAKTPGVADYFVLVEA